MRAIERTSRFKRDYKREARGRHRTYLDAILASVVEALANDRPLEPRHHDHALSGEWGDYRDCHVKPPPSEPPRPQSPALSDTRFANNRYAPCTPAGNCRKNASPVYT